jgi:lysozyme family protein
MISDQIIALVISSNEGGYVDNPADPGGCTNYGVTQRQAIACGYCGDMRALPIAVAYQIAKSIYWTPHNLDGLPPLIAFHVFDWLYNGGPAVAALQSAVGAIPDGNLGPVTIAAATAADQWRTIACINAARLQYLTSLSIWPSFGKGWANRIARNMKQVF